MGSLTAAAFLEVLLGVLVAGLDAAAPFLGPAALCLADDAGGVLVGAEFRALSQSARKTLMLPAICVQGAINGVNVLF